jgi:polyhydroxyalkanoate synthesis repressor PhaR
MAEEKQPITIKKYANRRLYNTGTSTYVTLEDLAVMVKSGEDFVVFDAKTGEDITRSVLAQIIFEQENKEGQSLLPIAFLRQLIRFYGDSMQMMVPRFLEQSMQSLTSQQGKFREQITQAFGDGNVREDLCHVRPALRARRPAQAGGGRRQAREWRRDGRVEAAARRDAEAAR